jgi:hypothetical protein
MEKIRNNKCDSLIPYCQVTHWLIQVILAIQEAKIRRDNGLRPTPGKKFMRLIQCTTD